MRLLHNYFCTSQINTRAWKTKIIINDKLVYFVNYDKIFKLILKYLNNNHNSNYNMGLFFCSLFLKILCIFSSLHQTYFSCNTNNNNQSKYFISELNKNWTIFMKIYWFFSVIIHHFLIIKATTTKSVIFTLLQKITLIHQKLTIFF